MLKYQHSIRSSEYAISSNAHVLYCAAERITIASTEYQAYIYLDERRQAKEKETFLKAIMEGETFVGSKGYTTKKKLNDFFTETKPTLLPFWMGMFVLLTNTDISGEEALRLYREKDGVEKCFDSLKNNLSLKRPRVHSQEGLEGLLFIEFIALIVYSHISKVLRERVLNISLSIPEALFKLRKIKKIRFGRKRQLSVKSLNSNARFLRPSTSQ